MWETMNPGFPLLDICRTNSPLEDLSKDRRLERGNVLPWQERSSAKDRARAQGLPRQHQQVRGLGVFLVALPGERVCFVEKEEGMALKLWSLLGANPLVGLFVVQ